MRVFPPFIMFIGVLAWGGFFFSLMGEKELLERLQQRGPVSVKHCFHAVTIYSNSIYSVLSYRITPFLIE